MAKSTGWAVNAINRPGSVGGVATRYVLNKAADGYTWLGAANYNKFVRPMGYTDSAAWIDWQHFAAADLARELVRAARFALQDLQ